MSEPMLVIRDAFDMKEPRCERLWQQMFHLVISGAAGVCSVNGDTESDAEAADRIVRFADILAERAAKTMWEK